MKSTAGTAAMRGGFANGRHHSSRRARGFLATLALAICALALSAAPASAAPPTVSISAASNVSYASAHALAQFANGQSYQYSVQYSTDDATWTNVPGTEGFQFPFAESNNVAADLTGLKGGTTYYLRARAWNFADPEVFSPQPDPQFTTLPVDPPAIISIDDASEVLYTVADASGEIERPANTDPAFDVNCNFEYVTDQQFSENEANSLPPFEGAGVTQCASNPVKAPGKSAVKARLENLTPGTTYHLRLSVSNAGGTESKAATSTFTTLPEPLPAPAVLSVDNASSLSYSTANASAEIQRPTAKDPVLDVNCNFEYVTDQQFVENEANSLPPFEGAGAAECKPENPVKAPGNSTVGAKLENLTPGTTYHLRLSISNAGGADSKVAPSTFTTLSSPPPPTVSIDPVTTFTGTTAHLSGKIDPNGDDPLLNTNWHFLCAPSCKTSSGESPSGTVVADGSEHSVEADVTGLEPNTAYQVELIATNEAGGADEAGPVSFKTDFLAPQAQTGFASEVEAGTATLLGKVNPHNSTVTYHFEYGLTESYGGTTPVTSLVDVDNVRHEVSQELSGLQPEALYHFRLSATNTESDETTHGVDHTFTTQPGSGPKSCPNQQLRAENNSLGLPDCRAYELVSPIKKGGNPAGANQEGAVAYSMATSDGNAVFFGTTGPMGQVRRGIENFAIGRRGDSGWSTEAAIPTGSGQSRISPLSYGVQSPLPSADLSKILFVGLGSWVPQNPQVNAGGAGSAGLYLGYPDDSVEWLSEPQIPFADSSPPPGHIQQYCYFQPIGASPDLSTVYFWSLSNLLPGETARVGHYGLYEYTDGVLHSAATLPPTAEHPEGVEPPGGAAPASSGETNCHGGTTHDSFGNQVSRDGSTLFFVSPDPGPGISGVGPVTQLYVRRAGHSTLISRMPNGDPAPDGVFPVHTLQTETEAEDHQFAVASPDGNTVIFQSHDALTPAAPPSGGTYRYRLDTDTVTYLPGVTGSVAAISDDGSRFLFGSSRHSGAIWDEGVIKVLPTTVRTPARVAASGSVFVYSGLSIGDDFNGGSHPQIFRYDAHTEQTSCLSCPPDGTVPTGGARLSERDKESETVPFPTDGEVLGSRAIDSEGSRVFFDSPDSLIPEDTNGLRDVYEWTPSGLSLISSGKDTTASYFLDNSADGDDVFIATAQGLDPRDTDGLYDVYDARVGGGFPQTQAVSPCGENATCKDASPSPPSQPGPTTNSFSSSGNPAPCPKGKVRKHGSCVKQKAGKRKHHKKAHKENKQRTASHGRGGDR